MMSSSHLRGIFAASSGAACKLSKKSRVLPASLLWSSLGKYCLLADNTGCVFPYDLSVTGKPPLESQPLSTPPSHLRYAHVHSPALDEFKLVPGARDVVHVDNHRRINHWVYNAETGISTKHGVSGFDSDCPQELSAASIAWHPMLKSARMYALVEGRPAFAVHLID